MRGSSDLTGYARLALFVAPWAVVPIVALSLKGGAHLSKPELVLSGVFLGSVFGLPLAYLATLIIGYPTYKLLLAYDCLNAWTLGLVGITAAGLLGWAFVGSEAVPLCSLCGASVAMASWWIIRREVTRLRESTASPEGPNKSLERSRDR